MSASPKQPTYVREDVVRVDQNISQKYHLMGSWIHDAATQTIFPTSGAATAIRPSAMSSAIPHGGRRFV